MDQDTSTQTLEVKPGHRPGTVRTKEGTLLTIPPDWELLIPGDAGLTRRVKAAGPSWTIKEKKGRRMHSKGVLAPKHTIEKERAKIEAERQTPAYQRKLESTRTRAAKKQKEYIENFHESVLRFLAFDPIHQDLADTLAQAVTAHATPVGSKTVARTQRIPIEQRAEAAVIAWMRHQTTAYDRMSIARVKGMRRAVRRQLAQRSKQLLDVYRCADHTTAPKTCPLQCALATWNTP